MQEERTDIVRDVVDHAHCVIANHVSQVVTAGCVYCFAVDVELGVIEVSVAAFEPEDLLESTLELRQALIGASRIAAGVPLAGNAGPVARISQHLCERGAVVVEISLIGGGILNGRYHVPDSGLVRIEAGQERCAGWTTSRGVVHLSEPDARLGQRVDVRCIDLAAVAADVGIPHIIGEDENDVRPFRCHDVSLSQVWVQLL